MQCKIGDLAFIKKSLRPPNIGLIIQCTELIGYLNKDEKFMWNGEQWAALDTGYYWLVTSNTNSIETQFGKAKQAFILDAWLTPINPLPEEDDISTEQTLNDEVEA